MRIVFMGTPDIAATCLKALLADNMDVVAVYTQPDRPKGRGMKLVASPVKETARRSICTLLAPSSMSSLARTCSKPLKVFANIENSWFIY